ncbi:MAG: N-6 DNA methylase, partial [Succinivibrio sp.]
MSSGLFAGSLVGVAEAAGLLRVTAATVRNWLKSGRISPEASDDAGRPLFSVKYLRAVRDERQKSAPSRQGGQSKSAPALPREAALSPANAQAVSLICSAVRGRGALCMRAALCEAAIRLMCRAGIVLNTSPRPGESCLSAWARGGIERSEAFDEVLAGLLCDYRADRLRQAAEELPDFKLESGGGDVLGLLYASFLDQEGRPGGGAFAPRGLCDKVAMGLGNGRDVFFDPCCGSGGFVLALLRRGISPDRVYGFDPRPMCVKIARVNAAIATGIGDASYYKRHF